MPCVIRSAATNSRRVVCIRCICAQPEDPLHHNTTYDLAAMLFPGKTLTENGRVRSREKLYMDARWHTYIYVMYVICMVHS